MEYGTVTAGSKKGSQEAEEQEEVIRATAEKGKGRQPAPFAFCGIETRQRGIITGAEAASLSGYDYLLIAGNDLFEELAGGLLPATGSMNAFVHESRKTWVKSFSQGVPGLDPLPQKTSARREHPLLRPVGI